MELLEIAREAQKRLLNNKQGRDLLDDVWTSSFSFLALTSMLCAEKGVHRPDNWVDDILNHPGFAPDVGWPYSLEQIREVVFVFSREHDLKTRWARFCEHNDLISKTP